MRLITLALVLVLCSSQVQAPRQPGPKIFTLTLSGEQAQALLDAVDDGNNHQRVKALQQLLMQQLNPQIKEYARRDSIEAHLPKDSLKTKKP